MMRETRFWLMSSAVVLLLSVVAAQAAVDKVICVPWQGDINRYHTTVSGHNLEIKGVIKTTDTSQVWYKWVFGDGTESGVTATNGRTKYNVQAFHVYTGADGTPFTAKLLVDDVDATMSNAVEDNYLLKIETDNLDAKINMAIDRGLWYLYKNMITSHSNFHTFDSSPYGVWTYSYYYASPTASAIHAFQINGHKETGNFDEDPYAEAVELGFNWLFNGYAVNTNYPMLSALNIGVQQGGNPDTNGNGKGIEVRDYGYRPIYEGGMIMDAIIASGTPSADTGRDFNGDGFNETYQQVLQDMVDMYAWGQYDNPNYGGWRYNWNQWPDNSACQWAAIGIIPAQKPPWNCTVPAFVKIYNDGWLNYSHYSWNGGLWGGFGYTSPSWGIALTPSGMVQLAFVGATTSDPRWVRCERWLSDSWKDVAYDWLDTHNVYAYYAFAKAMRLALPNPVVNFSAGTYAGFDWYRGGAVAGLGVKMGLAEKISNQLLSAGSWNYYGNNLGTAWCVIILRPVLFAEAPIACFDADPNPNYPDRDIRFDPGCSGHSAPGKDIDNLVLFEWDWDNDGTYDTSTATPTVVTHQFSTPTIPAVFPVTLRVTDDDDNSATYVVDIHITNPPHPPVSLIKGPMMVSLCTGDTLTLDGSDSYDPDEGTHEAGCGTCPDDTIIEYAWDLDGAPFDYTCATGQIVDLGTGFTAIFGSAGVYDVGLRVTDNSALSYPTHGGGDLTDEDFEHVYVYNCFDAGLTGTAGCGYVYLDWNADPDAEYYIIYKSSQGPNIGLEDTATVMAPDTEKTMGSFVMDMDTWFRIMAVDEDAGRTSLSLPVMVNGDPELCNPTADAGGPYEVCAGDVVTLDGSGSTAQIGTIIAWEWDLDNDGQYDDAFGETVQHIWNTPGNYTVGLKVISSDSFELYAEGLASVTINRCEVDVDVDIRPEVCPNPINVGLDCLVPVAILGSEDFDVSEIDPATVVLSRAGVADVVAAVGWAYEDVATPFEGGLCECHIQGPDGFLDLKLDFEKSHLVKILKLDEVVGQTVVLSLDGNLRPEFGGAPIVGKDCVVVVARGCWARNVGMTTATLCGMVIDDGPWQYRFRYCTEGGADNFTPWSSGFKAAGELFCQDISGLTPGCKYYLFAQVRKSAGQTDWVGPGSFTTLGSLLQLEAPNGGTYLAGSRCLICWKADPALNDRDVLIEYSTDNGSSWHTIGTVVNGDEWRSYIGGHYSWQAPAVTSDECLVRISDTSDPGIFDVSDNTFSIVMQAVPDVVGLGQADAEAAISAAGLVVGTITYAYDNSVAAGEVMGQYPGAGTPVALGFSVDLAVSAGPFAAGPPAVETEDAVNIGASSATLTGVVTDDGGGCCQYRFWYHEEGGDHYDVTPWSSEFKTAGESFSQDIDSLTPGTKYYFWAEVKNSAGESDRWGPSESFTTLEGLLQLQAPNGGTYRAGSRCLICWKADAVVSEVLVEYSTDNGGSWSVIDTVANGDAWRSSKGGYCSWQAPAVSSDECLVRISDTSDPSIFDVSESTFSIVP